MPRHRRVAIVLALLLAAFAATGCFNPFTPQILTERVTTVAPSPTSPENAVKLFEWCWVNRGVEEYKELFTDDYVFQSAETDSAGQNRNGFTRREDEVTIATNMFIGSADKPPAQKITLNFDKNLVPFPDHRAGKNPRWHKEIRTSVALNVVVEDNNSFEVTGHALFFLTRGDSAAIPQELKDRGFKPDSLRWWIDRWEDETIATGGGVVAGTTRAVRPARSSQPTTGGIVLPVSMSQLRAFFR